MGRTMKTSSFEVFGTHNWPLLQFILVGKLAYEGQPLFVAILFWKENKNFAICGVVKTGGRLERRINNEKFWKRFSASRGLKLMQIFKDCLY